LGHSEFIFTLLSVGLFDQLEVFVEDFGSVSVGIIGVFNIVFFLPFVVKVEYVLGYLLGLQDNGLLVDEHGQGSEEYKSSDE